MLNGDAGCISNARVATGQLRPGLVHGRRSYVPVQCLELVSLLARVLRMFKACPLLSGRLPRVDFGSHVTDAIQSGLGLAPTCYKVHRAVRTEFEVRYVQRPAAEKRFSATEITCPARRHVNGEDAAVCPIEDEQRTLVFWWKAALVAKLDGSWRAFADVQVRRHVVRVIGKVGRPRARHAAPTKVAARHKVIHTRRAVPRRTHVELRVGVIREHLAVRIEVDPKGVPKSGGDHFPCLSVTIGADYVALGYLDSATVFPIGRGPVDEFGGYVDRVTVNAVDHSVRTQSQIVATVTDASGEWMQQLDFVVAIVIVGVSQTIEALRVVGVGVQRVMGEQQTTAFQQIFVDRFHPFNLAAIGRHGHPQNPLVLLADYDAAFAIDRQANPRPFVGSRGSQSFNLESRKDLKGGGTRTCGHI